MKNPRVLQICHGYKGPFVHICKQYVAALSSARVTTVFLTGEKDLSIAEKIDGDVIFLGFSSREMGGLKLAPLNALKKICDDESYDIVLAHRYKAIYLACLLDRQFNFPQLAGIAHEHKLIDRWSRRLFLRIFGKRMLLAGVSRSVASDITSDLARVNAGNTVVVLPNVIDRNASAILSKTDARKYLGLNLDDYIVGSIGRLVKKKNFSVLLEAFADCPQEHGKLVIMGDGPERDELESLKSTLSLGEKMTFLGHVANAANLVSAFDVFVLSSGEAEAFGIVLLEAMQAHVPVISTDAPGPAEVVADVGMMFKNGNVEDLTRKLVALKHFSIDERQAMASNGAARVAQVYSTQQLTTVLGETFSIDAD